MSKRSNFFWCSLLFCIVLSSIYCCHSESDKRKDRIYYILDKDSINNLFLFQKCEQYKFFTITSDSKAVLSYLDKGSLQYDIKMTDSNNFSIKSEYYDVVAKDIKTSGSIFLKDSLNFTLIKIRVSQEKNSVSETILICIKPQFVSAYKTIIIPCRKKD